MKSNLSVYMPMDRRQLMAKGASIPERLQGAALFADISGFTPLTEALLKQLGPKRGAEELTRYLNLVYDALITELYYFGGSVIGFSGDAITCWLDGDTGLRAAACALAMQSCMQRFSSIAIPGGSTISLAMKAAIASGAVRRFLVGDPNIQLIDVIAGRTLEFLASAEHLAHKGEVILDQTTLEELSGQVVIQEERRDVDSGRRFGVINQTTTQVAPQPWPPLPDTALTDEQVRPWLLPAVYQRLKDQKGEFLAELRPGVALFMLFSGIDYEGDEQAGQKLDAFTRQVQRIISRYEGNVIQLTVGDKGSYLYAAFGAPVAHEDDTVRAASAALDLLQFCASLDFAAREQIGISQGSMRAGAYGGALRRTYGMLGDDTNLAARLMQAAQDGQILVSQNAQRSTEDMFNWEQLPPLTVKGKSTAITVYSLLGKKERRGIHLQEPTYGLPMVGRAGELALIDDKLQRVIQGKGQIIGITAEAGMGKSRLIAEGIRLANQRQMTGYGGECQSYGTNISYLVWQNIWRSFFEIDPGGSAENQQGAVQSRLEALDPRLAIRLPLLSAVLNLPIPDNELTSAMDAKLRKTSLEGLLVECLRAESRKTALLLVLEDCHWIDPLSQDLLEVVGRAIERLPVGVLIAYRPPQLDGGQAPRVSKLPHFTEIPLKEFTPDEAQHLIQLKLEQFLGAHTSASPALVKNITARAEGNPFYIEELLNYLQDRGLISQGAKALEGIDLPTSLQSLILTRIDQRTESQKATLKVASVIGRLFAAAWLWGAFPQLEGKEQVKTDLEILSRLDLTPLDTPEPELTYLFKHIVTQEVAYESLPYETRAVLHEQMGQFIERTFHDSLGQYTFLLAYHYERSDQEDKKREYLLKAGEAAQASYANSAAIEYYRRLLELLPESDQVPVLRKLGKVLGVVGDWEEAQKLYQRALSLATRLNDRSSVAWCQASIAEVFWKQGLYVEASQWLQQAQDGFEDLGDSAGVGQVLHYAGNLAAQQGEYEEARRLYQQSLEIRRMSGDKPNIAHLLSNIAILARYQSDLTQAIELNEEALAIKRELQDRWSISISLNNIGNVYLDKGDLTSARLRLEEAIELQREVGDRYYLAIYLNNLGNVRRAQGDFAEAHELYVESMMISQDLGAKWSIAYLLEDIGCLAVLQGKPARALTLIAAADKLRQEIGAPLSPSEQTKLENSLKPARQALQKSDEYKAWAEGLAMTTEEAIEAALGNE